MECLRLQQKPTWQTAGTSCQQQRQEHNPRHEDGVAGTDRACMREGHELPPPLWTPVLCTGRKWGASQAVCDHPLTSP